jgi:hypothetical protein
MHAASDAAAAVHVWLCDDMCVVCPSALAVCLCVVCPSALAVMPEEIGTMVAAFVFVRELVCNLSTKCISDPRSC